MNISKIEKVDWYEDYIVHWRPTDMCNYDCSYCDPSNHLAINKAKLPDVNKLIAASKKIRDAVPADKSVLVYITGGEPFLVKDVHKWLNWMSENKMRVGIFTNGSLPLRVYDYSKESFKNINIKISFHPESADVDKIVDFVNMIKDNNGNVEVRAMLAQGLFDKIFDLEKKLKDTPILKIPVNPLYNKTTKITNQTFASSRNLKGYRQKLDNGDLNYYTKQELEFIETLEQKTPSYLNFTVNDTIETNAIDFLQQRTNKFKGWKCGITNKKILIEANGNVKYGTCAATGIIGNIFEKEIELFNEEWTICGKEVCSTLDEIMITKFKLS
jgi:MoaA/NifB/PqqE/SkfB family radical SAM enzyme